MLSKEEYTPIELRKHCIKTMQFSNINSNAYKEHELILSIMDENISVKYKLEQLESDKQKLIEKLEEDVNELENLNDNYTDADIVEGIYTTRGQIIKAQEILSILKGENQVTVK